MKRIFTLLLFIPVIINAENLLINQLGYLTDSPKYVFVTGEADSFYIHAAGEILFREKLESMTFNDPATGLTIYRGDFSSFRQKGSFFITTNQDDSSFQFSISDTVFNDAYSKILKGFYYWRCGTLLSGTHAGPYFHPACHNTDGLYHSSTGKTGFNLSTGGWHDAGDYGKYIVNAGITVGTMLMGYELFPDRFQHDNLNIPESNNGIPDILDENRYELEWFLKMQDTSGGVFAKLTKKDFEAMVLPNIDSGTRYIYQIASTATGDFAAVMAQAYRIYKNIDTAFANKCLAAAKNAWSFLESNPSIVPPGGFKNPSDTHTGEYGDGNDTDERLWAAAELFLATGDNNYHNYFKANYNKNGVLNSQMSWGSVKSLGQLSYLTSPNTDVDKNIQNTLLESLKTYCNKLVSVRNSDGLQVALEMNEYNWGSTSNVMNKAIMLIIAYIKTNNKTFYDAALDQMNYIFGVNAHNISFVTGTGSNSVMHPHHRPSEGDGIVEPVPGYVAGGPNRYLNDPTMQKHFNSSTPPALCYIDDVGSYASNEVAINWNAPLVFVAGYFNGEGSTTGVETGEIFIPEKIRLEQNYPNPFNGMTMIKYSLKEQQDVELKVFNSIGCLVAEKKLGLQSQGTNQFAWKAEDGKGSDLSSGIYYYFLEGKEKSQVKKLMLLK